MTGKKKCLEYAFVYLFGGGVYCLLEVMWRGYTHWSMALCGGLCFLIIYVISGSGVPYIVKAVMGMGAITAVEFLVGYTVNVKLGMDVWDYSPEPYNVMGQICPRYTVLWLVLCAVAMPFCQKIRENINSLKSHPKA